MSQHTFETTYQQKAITVMLGWDKPLQRFYMVIEKQDLDDPDESDYLYSNLEEPDPSGLTLHYFKQKLDTFGIVVPESMFVEAKKDFMNGAVNRSVEHQADGSFRDLHAQ